MRSHSRRSSCFRTGGRGGVSLARLARPIRTANACAQPGYQPLPWPCFQTGRACILELEAGTWPVAGVRAGQGCGWCRAESVGWVSGSGWVFAGVTSAWGLRALCHWNFYPGAGRVALRQKDIPMKMTQGGVGAASLLTSVQPGPRPCPGGRGAARCRGLHSLLGRPFPEVIREGAELRMGLACCSLGLPLSPRPAVAP